MRLMCSFVLVILVEYGITKTYGLTTVAWESSHEPFRKSMVDSALFHGGVSISFGAIVHNSGGSFVCTKAGSLTNHISILEAEA